MPDVVMGDQPGAQYFAWADGLANGEDLLVRGPTAGAAVIHTIAHGDSCDVYLEEDPDGDGSFEVSTKFDSLTGEGMSQENQAEVNDLEDIRLRIRNTGSAADYIVSGRRVRT